MPDSDPPHHTGLLKATYDMVLQIHKEWPDVKGALIRHGMTQEEHNRRLAKLETWEEDTSRHNISELRRRSDRVNSTVFKGVVIVLAVLLGAGVYAAIRDISGGGSVQLPIGK